MTKNYSDMFAHKISLTGFYMNLCMCGGKCVRMCVCVCVCMCVSWARQNIYGKQL